MCSCDCSMQQCKRLCWWEWWDQLRYIYKIQIVDYCHLRNYSRNSNHAFLIQGCSSNQFTCNNGQCVPSTARCNSRRDCTDGSDETNCGNLEFIYYISIAEWFNYQIIYQKYHSGLNLQHYWMYKHMLDETKSHTDIL